MTLPWRIVLDVGVPAGELARAAEFYGRMLGAPAAALGGTELEIQVGATEGSELLVRVFEEVPGVREQPDRAHYNKGRTPRLELTVDDVAASVDEAVAGGATICCRLANGPEVMHTAEPGEQVVYAQLLDPFGHLWAFTLPER
jgi:uncharacterized glyoxalase superfamily protein PhnB